MLKTLENITASLSSIIYTCSSSIDTHRLYTHMHARQGHIISVLCNPLNLPDKYTTHSHVHTHYRHSPYRGKRGSH